MNKIPRRNRRLLLPALVAVALLPAMAFAQALKLAPQQLSRYWILLNTSVQMDAPNSGLNLDKPGCAAVTYTVGSDGVPLDVQVVKLVPKSDLGPMAASAVKNFRYGPSLTNRVGQPVATYYVMAFNGPADKVQRQHLMDACKLPGYGA